MRVLFADDAFLNACDRDGALRAGFTDRALRARHLGAIPGGLPRWLEKQLDRSVLRDALMNASVLETIPGWVLQGVVRGIAHALAKAAVERWLAGNTSKPKRLWDAGGGRDAEVAFVNFLDEALDQPDPLYRIRQRCDSTVSEGERAVCSALIERAGGSPQRATALFQELQQAWTVESGQLRQFVVLHHAIAAGGAGDFNLSVDLLKVLVKHSSPVPWIKLYALRYLLHTTWKVIGKNG
jgi:hypothetical protein